ncbi:hypothetical protein ERO13_D13G063050v2 [Gossypium hirsutum]|nr:hypothetical protein ERO13_D13G063050v2 [Gossypium hirsutum]
MNPQHHPQSKPDLPVPPLTSLRIQPTSPRVPLTITPTTGAQRRIAIIVNLSDESAYAPLVDAKILFKIHIVKDHDLKERLCLEVERLGLSAVIMGSRGFGAARRTSKGRLGSVNDYFIHHYIFSVLVVRYPDEEETKKEDCQRRCGVQPVPKEELEYYDAEEEHRGLS